MVINYVDRQMLGVLKPFMAKDLGWSEQNYADIVFYFQLAYSVSYLLFGAFVDRVGAKLGYAIAFIIWQLAHIAHAGATSLTSFFAVRMVLGIGEGGNFPACIKAVTREWFPKNERAFATGVFNAGSNIGAIVTPLAAPAIYYAWGWRAAFLITGVIGLLWLVAWFALYKTPGQDTRLTSAERAHIEQDGVDAEQKVGWLAVAARRETWAYAAGRFLIDPVWWVLLFWLPDFIDKTFHTGKVAFMLSSSAVWSISISDARQRVGWRAGCPRGS